MSSGPTQCANLALLAIVFGALATGLGAAFGRRVVVPLGAVLFGRRDLSD
ncbi:hypothetical protein AB0D24_40270 [Streptomyces javensis]